MRAALFIFSWLFLTPSVLATDVVTVRLFTSEKSVRRITFLAPAMLKIAHTEIPLEPPFSIEKRQAALILLTKSSSHGKGIAFRSCAVFSLNGRPVPVSINVPRRTIHTYLGHFDVSVSNASMLQIFNVVNTRDYVNSVVASEAPPGSPPEMLKAQAILVQTLLSRLASKRLIDDSTQSECYAGYTANRPEVVSAVSSVWGSRLVYHDKPIQVFFHSTCAGSTSSAQQFFHLAPGSLPYLIPVTCNYCKDSPFYREKQATLPSSLVAGLFNSSPPVILTTDQSKRPLTISVGQRRVSGYDYWIRFGQKFGWDKMPGTRFAIENQPAGRTVLRSSGAGHGVGLCQWGAIGLAKAGKSYRQILKYYFPDCAVVP
jgi:stage II sporulation protein D